MWRKLNREDLISGAPHFLEIRGDIPFKWCVYEKYELADLDGEQYFETADVNSIKHVYKPLEDLPHLFLEFARLKEQRDLGEALNEWIFRRGLLGLHKRRRPEADEIGGEAWRPGYRYDRWWARDPWRLRLTEYMHEGGPSESLDSIRGEVFTANRVLTAWEAVLSGEPERAEQVLIGPFSPPYSGTLKDGTVKEHYIGFLKTRASELGLTYGEHLLHHAAYSACIVVQKVL